MIYFVGAGPGDPELLTLRGKQLLQNCQCCIYAGSLVNQQVLDHLPTDAERHDSAEMDLEDIIEVCRIRHADGAEVVRLHSGDPSLYGAIAEQMRRLDELGIAYDVTPGVPAYTAAAAELKTELTLPEVSQTIVLTRTAGKASGMPNRETLDVLGQSGATLAIHLSVRNIAQVQRELIPLYGADCPVVVVYRASWPDQQILRGTLGDIDRAIREAKLTRTALILVGQVLESRDFRDSDLYSPDHAHVLRPKGGTT